MATRGRGLSTTFSGGVTTQAPATPSVDTVIRIHSFYDSTEYGFHHGTALATAEGVPSDITVDALMATRYGINDDYQTGAVINPSTNQVLFDEADGGLPTVIHDGKNYNWNATSQSWEVTSTSIDDVSGLRGELDEIPLKKDGSWRSGIDVLVGDTRYHNGERWIKRGSLNPNTQEPSDANDDWEKVTNITNIDGVPGLRDYLNTLALQSNVDISVGLPGFPVDIASDNLSMALFPSLTGTTADANRRVSTLTDAIDSSFQFTAINSNGQDSRPTLMHDDIRDAFYLRFDDSTEAQFLRKEDFNPSGLAGDTFQTSTVIAVTLNERSAYADETLWNWTRRTGSGYADGDFNSAQRFSAHLPWGTGIIYIDHGSVFSQGRLETTSSTAAGNLGDMKIWVYRRNGASANLSLNNSLLQTTNGLSANLGGAGQVGRFTIGATFNASQSTNMRLYAFFVYNKSLTDAEVSDIYLYLSSKFL